MIAIILSPGTERKLLPHRKDQRKCYDGYQESGVPLSSSQRVSLTTGAKRTISFKPSRFHREDEDVGNLVIRFVFQEK
ncbi:hypothetical protein BHM03_00029243 [Ensete ventricosum]|uniref:Uncharacterized protein n=1 Tax=Ensete ventricosum TaxID=4639 RepID=A0A445MIA0_ENSVE|nr:hypothetical protein BHM03_00029243 [Ensete ventricosum]